MNAVAIPDELNSALAAGRCAVLVGAGASQSSGFPGWRTLLLQLIAKGVSKGFIQDSEQNDLEVALADSSKYLDIAQHLSDKYGEAEIRRELALIFNDNTKTPSRLHESIINADFKFTITTNYDRLLEDAYAKKNLAHAAMLTLRDGVRA